MKYFVIVGEASGDVHASKLLKEIMALDCEADIRFWGGDRMAEVVGQQRMLSHYRDGAFMGVWEVLRNIRTLARRLSQCKRDITEFAPDVVILVDFAGFNMKIAKFAKSRRIKTYYYIAPKVWAWRESRAKAIGKYVDELFAIFPFEIDFFRRWGIEAHYFGNPIMEEIIQKRSKAVDYASFAAENALDNRPIIALLAGSRKQEVVQNLPFMNSVAEALPDYQFVVAAVDWLDSSLYESVVSNSAPNIKVLYNKTYDTLLNSQAAIVTSGTATLETALLGVPEVVCYKCSPLNYFLGRLLIRIKYISLVNIVMNRLVVKELINSDMRVDSTIAELGRIVQGGSDNSRILADYSELRDKMGGSDTSRQVARKMVELLKADSR